jgi:DNA-binding LacI/PurR family transcriptional regulator
LRTALEALEVDGIIEPIVGRRGRRVSAAASPNPFLARTIAMLADNHLHRQHLMPQWPVSVLHETGRVALRRGYHVLHLQGDYCRGENFDMLLAAAPRGLVVLGDPRPDSNVEHLVEEFLRRSLPVAVCSDYGAPAKASTVGPDYREGTRQLTQWLLDRGRRRIIPCWTVEANQLPPRSIQRRSEGYIRALKAAGIQPLPTVLCHLLPTIVNSQDSVEVSIRLIAGHLAEHVNQDQPIDAVLTVSDAVAGLVGAAARLLGLEPGRDIDIAGFGNCQRHLPRWELPTGPTVTVDIDAEDLAERLVETVAIPPESTTNYLATTRIVVP